MLGKFHIYLGITIVIIFLLTGQYMRHNYNSLQDMEMMNRALFRAGHLYILLFGLIHAALGSSFKIAEKSVLQNFQKIASVIMCIATFLVIYAFFTELPSESIERPVTSMSLYLILLGVSIHGIISLLRKNIS